MGVTTMCFEKLGAGLCAGIGALVLPALMSGTAPAQTLADPPVAAAAAVSAAQAPAGAGTAFFENTELGGLVDAYYAWYSTKQRVCSIASTRRTTSSSSRSAWRRSGLPRRL